MNMKQTLPTPSWPLVGPTGVVDDVWYSFLQSLYARTGGATGASSAGNTADITALQASVATLNTQVPVLQQGIADLDVLALSTDEPTQVAVIAARVSAVEAAVADATVVAFTQDL